MRSLRRRRGDLCFMYIYIYIYICIVDEYGWIYTNIRICFNLCICVLYIFVFREKKHGTVYIYILYTFGTGRKQFRPKNSGRWIHYIYIRTIGIYYSQTASTPMSGVPIYISSPSPEPVASPARVPYTNI